MAGEAVSTSSHVSDRRYNILDAYLNPQLFDLKILPGGFQDSSLKLNGSLLDTKTVKWIHKEERTKVVDWRKM